MNNGEFKKSLDITNNLEYRYNELIRKYKNATKDIVGKNNIIINDDSFLIESLRAIIKVCPEKTNIIQEAINMIYSDEILTEYNLEKLKELYSKIFN